MKFTISNGDDDVDVGFLDRKDLRICEQMQTWLLPYLIRKMELVCFSETSVSSYECIRRYYRQYYDINIPTEEVIYQTIQLSRVLVEKLLHLTQDISELCWQLQIHTW
jgi:hypothetical protein